MISRTGFKMFQALGVGVVVAVGLAAAPPVDAQQAAGGAKGKMRLGVYDVKITEGAQAAARAAGADEVVSFKRVTSAMDGQLIDRLHSTGKFDILARSDLDALLKEQSLTASGNIDTSDAAAAQAFKLLGATHTVVLSVDDFQDRKESLRGAGGDVIAQRRVVRFSGVLKLYDLETGVLVATANLQESNEKGQGTLAGREADGRDDEELLILIARQYASDAAVKVVDFLYPARVIGLTGGVVTISRGAGAGIEEGQVWTVYGLGEALIDPDTGESLGSEEVELGRVQVTQVTPRFSKAKVLEDNGIDKLNILRLNENP